MFRKKIQIKVIALFVVAFICLNAGGALCVAYCQSFDMAAESSEHCPLKKQSADCHGHHGTASDSAAAIGDEMDCCPMTVSFFAGPVEKSSFSFHAASSFVEAPQPYVVPVFAGFRILDRAYPYRGPPLDRRIDRIKNCIIRI